MSKAAEEDRRYEKIEKVGEGKYKALVSPPRT